LPYSTRDCLTPPRSTIAIAVVDAVMMPLMRYPAWYYLLLRDAILLLTLLNCYDDDGVVDDVDVMIVDATR